MERARVTFTLDRMSYRIRRRRLCCANGNLHKPEGGDLSMKVCVLGCMYYYSKNVYV